MAAASLPEEAAARSAFCFARSAALRSCGEASAAVTAADPATAAAGDESDKTQQIGYRSEDNQCTFP